MSSRLPVVSGREATKALTTIGFRVLSKRGKGSHIVVVREDPRKLITIPDHRELDRGTLRSIIRQADLTVDEFVELLRK